MQVDWNLQEDCKLKVGATLRKCLLAYGQRGQQKVAVADDTRRLLIYDITKTQYQLQQKTAEYDRQITACCISDDLVFFSTGSEVRAINKKGREVYCFDTFLADNIRNILVQGYKLWVVGDTLLNQFEMAEPALLNNKSRKANNSNNSQKTRESSYFMSEDSINDCFVYRQTNNALCVILRKNNQIQMIDRGEVVAFIKVDGVPQCCNQANEQTYNQQSNLIGLVSGNVVCLLTSTVNGKRVFKKEWQILHPSNKIVSLHRIPKGVLICRPNILEIWTRQQDHDVKFEQTWHKNTQDALAQCIYLESQDEIIYSTVTGKLVSLCNTQKRVEKGKQDRKQEEDKKIMDNLKRDIEALETEYERLKSEQSAKMGNKVAAYRLQHDVHLNTQLHCYSLHLSCSLTMTKLILEGPIRINPENKQVVFQSQKPVRRYLVRLDKQTNTTLDYFIKEGEDQPISVLVFLSGQRELAHSLTLEVKALCLHTKVDNKMPNAFKNNNQLNKLTVVGKFSKAQMISWLSVALDIGKNVSEDQTVFFVFESVQTKQKLVCQLRDDQAVLYAQALTPLIIVKKVLTKKGKERDAGLRLKLEPNVLSVEKTLKALEPKMLEFEDVDRSYKLLPGLIELSTYEDGKFLSERYLDIISRQEEIRSSYVKNQLFYDQMKSSLMELYRCFQAAKDVQLSDFQRDNFVKRLQQFNLEEVKNTIIN